MTHQNPLKLKLMAATAASALLLSACGGGGETESVNAPSPATKPAEVELSGESPIYEPYTLTGASALDVDAFFAMMGDEDDPANVSYGSANFDENTGATVIEQLTTTDEDSTLTVGRMELFGVNEAHIQALKDTEGAVAKDEVFRKVRMFDVTVAGNGEDDAGGIVTIDGLEIDGLRLGGMTQDETAELGDGQEFAAAMKAFDLGAIYIDGLSMQGIETEGTGITMAVADMRFGGVSAGKFGPISIENMDYTITQSDEAKAALIEAADPQMKAILGGPLGNIIMPGKQRATIGSLTFDGFSFAGLLPYLESGESAPLSASNLLFFGKLEARDAEMYVNDKLASTTGYSVVEPVEFSWLVPTRIKSYSTDVVSNLTAYVPEEMPEMLTLFQENGLDNLTGESEMLWTYDETSGDASLVIDTDTEGFANFDISFNASEAVLETLHASATEGEGAAFQNVAIDGMTIRIEDEKLLDVIFAVAASQMGQDPQQLRASAPLMINMGGQQFAQMNPAFPAYLAAISNWIGTGGAIEIAVAPEAPVALSTLAATGESAPQTLPDVLGLSVTHTAPEAE
ncbi:hypothetical protein [Parvularcula sp. IMCC14364]|uniref:hypothetical protein n=1 Tax=Parvularcula sp. IMCC14364 TaxID=3067902 RepID=UPI00274197B9|nr:hypothetical protein [Parvularcula sp. IMCC14364]